LEDVGEPIEKIRIGHDDSGFASGWHLDRVEVKKLKSKGTVSIPLKLFQLNFFPTNE
jgi:hypothetical protein